MSVWPAVETFCTIMSTLTLASARSRNTVAATPGRSGTCSIVTFASDESCVTPEMIACSIDSIEGSSFVIHVPGAQLKLERTWIFTSWLRANSTDRSASTRPPVAAISSISSNDTLAKLARGRDDPRVGGVHAVDVGVDLAHLGAERGRDRDRGGVGAAPPERRDVAVGRDALEAGDHGHPPRRDAPRGCDRRAPR